MSLNKTALRAAVLAAVLLGSAALAGDTAGYGRRHWWSTASRSA